MNAKIATRDTLIVDASLREEAAEVVRNACDRSLHSVVISVDGDSIVLPPKLSEFLVGMIQRTAHGGVVSVMTAPDEVTSTVAAEMLGISRPTLLKLVNSGELECHMVGSHHRFKAGAVRALAQKRSNARRVAFAELTAVSEELSRS
jgi:excisionase family DNA binding protein